MVACALPLGDVGWMWNLGDVGCVCCGYNYYIFQTKILEAPLMCSMLIPKIKRGEGERKRKEKGEKRRRKKGKERERLVGSE